MSVTFVTAFIRLSDRDPADYVNHFKRLAETGIDLCLFMDCAFREIGEMLCSTYSNVRIPEYVTLDPVPEHVVLPSDRTIEKDTAEYLMVQLSKLKFMNAARRYTLRPFLAWIDFRIFHVLHNHERAVRTLRLIEQDPPRTTKILAPGCWNASPRQIWSSILWRFCGGFLLSHRERVQAAYERQMELVRRGLPQLTWEVNYWTLMEDAFEWYPGDHNDTILPSIHSEEYAPQEKYLESDE